MRSKGSEDSITPAQLMIGDSVPQLGGHPIKFEQAVLPNFPVELYSDDEMLKKTGWKITADKQLCKNSTELPNILNIR